jgi:DegV family protein with EDD domain
MGGRQVVQVITDSTADIPPDVANEAGVKVVPLSIKFGGDVYRDGVDLSGEAFYHKLRSAPVLPTTSAPSPGAFLEAYREALAMDRRVLSIHLSAALSATHNAATLAAAECPEGQVEVVDSRNCSMAVGWVALLAAEEARKGATLERIRALVGDLMPRAHLYAVLDTLENLRRGGRIGRAAAFLGTLLNVKPIVTIAQGEVMPVQKVRLLDRALERLVEIAQEHAPIERMAVAQTDAPRTFERLREMVASAMPGLEILNYRAGAVVGALAGEGAVALVFIGGRRGG